MEKPKFNNRPERVRPLKPSEYQIAINGLSFSINNPRGLVIKNRKRRVTPEQMEGEDK